MPAERIGIQFFLDGPPRSYSSRVVNDNLGPRGTQRMDSGLSQSLNFRFLATHDPVLERFAAQAEHYFSDDPTPA